MSILDEREARDQAEVEEKKLAKAQARQLRLDVQAMFATPEARRVLWSFLQASSVDVSPLRGDPQATGHAIGWADAGGWWLNALRAHCPEKETAMRAEARRNARNGQKESDDE